MVDIFIVDPANTQSDGPNGEDYFPCTCNEWGSVFCHNVTFDEIARVFRRTTPAYIYYFSLKPSLADANEMIPPDLLNNHRVTEYLNIYCYSNGFSLRVDPQAFRSSKNTTESIHFHYCDTNGFNFQFLSGFDKLIEANFYRLSKVGLADWASFPTLANLYIEFVLRTRLDLTNGTIRPTFRQCPEH